MYNVNNAFGFIGVLFDFLKFFESSAILKKMSQILVGSILDLIMTWMGQCQVVWFRIWIFKNVWRIFWHFENLRKKVLGFFKIFFKAWENLQTLHGISGISGVFLRKLKEIFWIELDFHQRRNVRRPKSDPKRFQTKTETKNENQILVSPGTSGVEQSQLLVDLTECDFFAWWKRSHKKPLRMFRLQRFYAAVQNPEMRFQIGKEITPPVDYTNTSR